MPDIHFQLRAANSDDLGAVYDLFAEVQSIHAKAEPDFFKQPAKDDMFTSSFERTLSDPEQNLVFACAAGTPVGYVLFFAGTRPENIYQPKRRFAYIHQLAVKKRFRRTGCASTLIEHVKIEARKQDIALLGIDFWSFNDAARACFERNGFKVNQEFMWLRL